MKKPQRRHKKQAPPKGWLIFRLRGAQALFAEELVRDYNSAKAEAITESIEDFIAEVNAHSTTDHKAEPT